jgi:hypothetical protein
MKAREYKFDPVVLADLETEMWRAYYDKQVLALFRLSLRVMREQLTSNPLQTLIGSYRLTAAAFVFKRGKERADYRKALRWLVPFYRAVGERRNGNWSSETVADLELEWWIIHRHAFGPGNTAKLETALAEYCALLYNLPVEEVAEYAFHRAVAMLISDEGLHRKRRGEPGASDWEAIRAELLKSYSSLHEKLKVRHTKTATPA